MSINEQADKLEKCMKSIDRAFKKHLGLDIESKKISFSVKNTPFFVSFSIEVVGTFLEKE